MPDFGQFMNLKGLTSYSSLLLILLSANEKQEVVSEVLCGTLWKLCELCVSS